MGGEARGGATEGDRRRLDELKVTLDQCWDLLRQRLALEEFDWTRTLLARDRRRWSERYEQ